MVAHELASSSLHNKLSFTRDDEPKLLIRKTSG
jgi:hypothetical protein